MKDIKQRFEYAKKTFESYGVNVDEAIERALEIPLSVHCWQGDDLTGFITDVDKLSDGGIMATGNFPGKARTPSQLRSDMEKAFSYIPGKKRVSLHAIYAESGKKIDLSELDTAHFEGWIAWAKEKKYGLDFNPTCFSHPMLKDGFTLSSKDREARAFWIEHVKRSRKIAADIGKALGTPCVNNIWIPDGSKENSMDRFKHRKLLMESLDEILSVKYDPNHIIDTVESKLFGLGSESFVAGSHEFYLLYSQSRKIVPCMDLGHFHPTELVADKISAMLLFLDKVHIHISRGVRWDSDHVPVLDGEMMLLMQEVNRMNAFDRTLFSLDFFDGSINRLMAWIVGARTARKAILFALLEPVGLLREAENEGALGRKLSLFEEFKTLPYGDVWDMLCAEAGIMPGAGWIKDIEDYEKTVLLKR